MIRCAICGVLKRHAEIAITTNRMDLTGRVVETVGVCNVCHEQFQQDLIDPNSQASGMLREILVQVAKRGPTRWDA